MAPLAWLLEQLLQRLLLQMLWATAAAAQQVQQQNAAVQMLLLLCHWLLLVAAGPAEPAGAALPAVHLQVAVGGQWASKFWWGLLVAAAVLWKREQQQEQVVQLQLHLASSELLLPVYPDLGQQLWAALKDQPRLVHG